MTGRTFSWTTRIRVFWYFVPAFRWLVGFTVAGAILAALLLVDSTPPLVDVGLVVGAGVVVKWLRRRGGSNPPAGNSLARILASPSAGNSFPRSNSLVEALNRNRRRQRELVDDRTPTYSAARRIRFRAPRSDSRRRRPR